MEDIDNMGFSIFEEDGENLSDYSFPSTLQDIDGSYPPIFEEDLRDYSIPSYLHKMGKWERARRELDVDNLPKNLKDKVEYSGC